MIWRIVKCKLVHVCHPLVWLWTVKNECMLYRNCWKLPKHYFCLNDASQLLWTGLLGTQMPPDGARAKPLFLWPDHQNIWELRTTHTRTCTLWDDFFQSIFLFQENADHLCPPPKRLNSPNVNLCTANLITGLKCCVVSNLLPPLWENETAVQFQWVNYLQIPTGLGTHSAPCLSMSNVNTVHHLTDSAAKPRLCIATGVTVVLQLSSCQ